MIVYSYTDEDALRDGVLVNIGGPAPFPINRATRAVWEAFTAPMGRMPKSMGASPVTDTTQLSRLCETAKAKMVAGELQEGWVVMEYEGHPIWCIPNGTSYSQVHPEVEGWTLLFPSDY
mgnify:CR=1 FL=1